MTAYSYLKKKLFPSRFPITTKHSVYIFTYDWASKDDSRKRSEGDLRQKWQPSFGLETTLYTRQEIEEAASRKKTLKNPSCELVCNIYYTLHKPYRI